MKKSNREINIFSMSALDLFASALGAFILISIVLFPFFPNIGSSPENIAALREELRATQDNLKQTQAALQDTQTQLQEAQAEIDKIKIPDIDLVIALDITGSMGKEITGLKGQINDLAMVLDIFAPSVGIGIIAFGDRQFDHPLTVQNILEITASTSILKQLENFVDRLESNMGMGGGENTDTPEAVDLALQRAIGMSWRPQATRRYIVIITDNPAYPEKVADTHRLAREFSSTAGSSVSTVLGSASNATGARTYLMELASAGKGKFIDLGGSVLSGILAAILG